MTDDPTLEICQLTFHTNGAGKNNDTHVLVEARTDNGEQVARIDNDFGHFRENSDAGPYNLTIINPASKTKVKGGSTLIRIDPNRPNTWQFNFFLDLIFSDDSHLFCEATNVELDEKRQQTTFGIA